MEVFKTKADIQSAISQLKAAGRQIALVPTMGALHEGHLALVKQAAQHGAIVVCSIFVNPTQFNDPEDLKKYPRPIERDIQLLESAGCDILFLPEVEEIYSGQEVWNLELGYLDEILEGEHRPGHFQGVTQVVYKLFDIVRPHQAVFGLKDLQQFMVVQRLIDLKQLPVELIPAPIVREKDGLAMSSRNVRLSEQGRKHALSLYQTLQSLKADFPQALNGHKRIEDLRMEATSNLEQAEGVQLEYLEICELYTLKKVDEHTPLKNLVAVVAAWVEGVRLIDNMILDETIHNTKTRENP